MDREKIEDLGAAEAERLLKERWEETGRHFTPEQERTLRILISSARGRS